MAYQLTDFFLNLWVTSAFSRKPVRMVQKRREAVKRTLIKRLVNKLFAPKRGRSAKSRRKKSAQRTSSKSSAWGLFSTPSIRAPNEVSDRKTNAKTNNVKGCETAALCSAITTCRRTTR